MSSFFSYYLPESNSVVESLFGTTSSAETPPAVAPQPPATENDWSSSFFSFFSTPSTTTTITAPPTITEDPCYCDNSPSRRGSEAGPEKTLSEMAQTLSDLAEDTLRSLSPAPPPAQPAGLSYRRKTIAMPGGIPPDSLQLLYGQSPTEPAETTKVPDAEKYPLTTPDKFPTYAAKKVDKSTPLLSALTDKNRQSFISRNDEIEEIMKIARSKAQEPEPSYKVSNFTGQNPTPDSPTKCDVPSCTQNEIHHNEEGDDESVLQRRKYDSEDFLEVVRDELNMLEGRISDEDEVIVSDLDYSIFAGSGYRDEEQEKFGGFGEEDDDTIDLLGGLFFEL